ncbi:RDD family protein [Pedobacter sp. UBA4863]|uniref:RDD family protein n=1 Tax=Pedobacter sp. UBA4863 TaxID=1947060 RepID=UPI0025DD51B6|nr:RDD family protein [Pedobacter sp. UBA4863]
MYTIVVKGKPQGPYTLEELKQMAILPDTFVRKPGMDDYKEAHEIAELRELLGFVAPQHIPQYFASFDQRLMAWAIDYFIITLVYAIIVALAVVYIADQQLRMVLLITGIALVPFTKFLYNVIGDASKTQGTVGKKLMDIKVTDECGARITLGISIARNLAKILSNFLFGFGYIYCFFNKKQQCLHDVIAKTLVIKDRLL